MSFSRHLPTWFVLPPAVRNSGPTRQPPGNLSPLSRESFRGQTNGHNSGRVSRGWPHTALHVAVREPCDHHTEEIRQDSAYYQQQKLNNISILGQLPIPRLDEILDKMGRGRIFSLFDLVSSFHQTTVHKDTILLTAFCRPTRLFEWLVMPQVSKAAPGWFVKVINEVIKGLANVAAYLDEVIVSSRIPPLTSSPLRDCSNRYVNTTSSSSRRRRRSVPPTWIFSVASTPAKSLPLRKCRCLQTSSNYGPSLAVYPTTGIFWQTWPRELGPSPRSGSKG